MSKSIKVTNVRMLTLDPDKKYVILLPKNTSPEEADEYGKALSKFFEKNPNVLISNVQMKFTEITDANS